jgi:2-dehydropantoate 2-reductase
MRILIIGAGAVGGIFGARLVQAGRDVTFLVHKKRADIIRRNGLQIVGANGDATLHPKLTLRENIGDFFDLVFVGVKGYGLAAAIDDFAPAVGPETTILPVLNGMQHIKALQDRFGEKAVIGGLVRVAGQVDGQGRIHQLAGFEQMRYGELAGSVTDRLRAIDGVMQDAQFDATLSTDIVQDMWEKWVQLTALGAVTCLFRGSIGAVESVVGGADLALSILGECAEVAAACGHRQSTGFLDQQSKALTEKGSSLTSSMFRDLTGGASVEVDQIMGDFLGRAEAANVPTPLLKAAFVNLRVYQNKLERQLSEQSNRSGKQEAPILSERAARCL